MKSGNLEVSSGVSRRDFLRGAGIAAAGLAATGALAGCSSPAGQNAASTWDQEADVVIVGYGGAGACAAMAAADKGAKVLVIEKNPEDAQFCNTVMAGGGFHSQVEGGDKEALKEYLRAMFSGDNTGSKYEPDISPLFVDDLVENFATYVADNVAFMQSCDPDFNPIDRGKAGAPAFPDFPGAKDCGYRSFLSSYGDSYVNKPYPTLDIPKEESAAGLAFFYCLKNGVEQRGDAISVKFETPAKELIQNDKGEIIGVVATSGDSDIRIKANRAVILTCGGFEYNEEMRRAFMEGEGVTGWAFYGTPSNTGDGIRMGIAAGAQLAKVGKAASRFIWACPDKKVGNLMMGSQCDVVGSDGTIVVNSGGKRFMDETLITKDPSRYFSYKNAVHMDITTLEYPNNPSYLIFDETKRKSGCMTTNTQSTVGFGFIEWDADNQNAIDKGWLIKGDTIEELAQKIKDSHDLNMGRMDPDNLVATMAQYQEMVDTGVDTAFGRSCQTKNIATGEVLAGSFSSISTPPFYAMPLVAGGPNTKGGLQVDGSCHVVDWDNQRISRLYSAGEISSCFKFVYQGGGNLTECIVCGRIAGEQAASEEAWTE